MSPAPNEVFDRNQLRHRRNRAAETCDETDFLRNRILDDIEDRLLATQRKFPLALSLGSFSPKTRARLARFCTDLIESDLSERRLSGATGPGLATSEEWLPFRDNAFDLIVSPLSLHWVNDLPGALIQINRALRPDGFFIGVMPGGGTLRELRQSLLQAETELSGGAEMRVSPFADAFDMASLLQRAGFALPVSDRDRMTIRYSSMFELLKDLQAVGETHAPYLPGRKPLSRRTLMRAAEIYASEFADPDGRIRATLELIWITGWAPHASQPRPKRPGSARASLAQAVGAQERSAGEKTGFLKPQGPEDS